MLIHLREGQRSITVEIQPHGGAYRVVVDGTDYAVEAASFDVGAVVLTIDNHRHRVHVARNGRERLVAIDGEIYRFVPEQSAAAVHDLGMVASPEITAPMPGKVLDVLVRAGDHVDAGDGLLIMEAMKMENRLVAEAAATVTEIRVAAGDMVDGGQVLMVLAYDQAM